MSKACAVIRASMSFSMYVYNFEGLWRNVRISGVVDGLFTYMVDTHFKLSQHGFTHLAAFHMLIGNASSPCISVKCRVCKHTIQRVKAEKKIDVMGTYA